MLVCDIAVVAVVVFVLPAGTYQRCEGTRIWCMFRQEVLGLDLTGFEYSAWIKSTRSYEAARTAIRYHRQNISDHLLMALALVFEFGCVPDTFVPYTAVFLVASYGSSLPYSRCPFAQFIRPEHLALSRPKP